MLETSFRIDRDQETTTPWLPAYGRTVNIGFDPICYGTAVTAQRQVGTATAQRNFFYIGNAILTALTEFLRNLHNGNGETATAERQRNGGNQALFIFD